jgi:hypothetical protein
MLFVDDILLVINDSLVEGRILKETLQLYNKATRMEININKYTKSFNAIDEGSVHILRQLVPFTFVDLYSRIKYLGYYLKPNGFHNKDWQWLT